MIGKIPKTGRGFRGTFNYLVAGKRDEKQADKLAWMETRNLFVKDPDKIPSMMRATASQAKRCQKPVYHMIISWRPDEAPTDPIMKQVADRALIDMGLHEHQAVLAAHRDTHHRHLHIVVNRVHPETGKAWHTGKDWERLERSIARQALELGMVKVDGRHNTPEKMAHEAKRARDAEYQLATRKQNAVPLDRWSADDIKSRRAQLSPLFDQARSWDHLARLLNAEGLSLIAKGQGLVISDGMGTMKLSDLGKEIRLKSLETLYRESFRDFSLRQPVPEPEPAQQPTPANPRDEKDAIRRAWRTERQRAADKPPADAAADDAADDQSASAAAPPATQSKPQRTPRTKLPSPRDEAYRRVHEAREQLDVARDMHRRGHFSNNELLGFIDAHAAARDDLAKLIEQEPDKAMVREEWRRQAQAHRQALSSPPHLPPKQGGENGNEDANAAADTPPAHDRGPTPSTHPSTTPSPRHEAFRHLSRAHEQLDIAKQLHAMGILSKQDLIIARNELSAARDEMTKHQTFSEFVGDGVRQTLSGFTQKAAKPAPKPDLKSTRTQKMTKPRKTRSKDNDRDR